MNYKIKPDEFKVTVCEIDGEECIGKSWSTCEEAQIAMEIREDSK